MDGKATHKGKQVANNASDLTIPHGKPTRRNYKAVVTRKGLLCTRIEQ
jgi:hypothetical protein